MIRPVTTVSPLVAIQDMATPTSVVSYSVTSPVLWLLVPSLLACTLMVFVTAVLVLSIARFAVFYNLRKRCGPVSQGGGCCQQKWKV